MAKQIPQVLSVSEAARILDMPGYTVQREIKRGNLKAYRVGWFWAIKRSDLKRYAKSQ